MADPDDRALSSQQALTELVHLAVTNPTAVILAGHEVDFAQRDAQQLWGRPDGSD